MYEELQIFILMTQLLFGSEDGRGVLVALMHAWGPETSTDMASIRSYVHAHGTRFWILIWGDVTLGGAGKGEPSVVEPRDLIMTLEAVMRTQVPMKHGTPEVLLYGVTLIKYILFY